MTVLKMHTLNEVTATKGNDVTLTLYNINYIALGLQQKVIFTYDVFLFHMALASYFFISFFSVKLVFAAYGGYHPVGASAK